MALNLADYLSASPELIAALAQMGSGGPATGLMPYDPRLTIGTQPVQPGLPMPANPGTGGPAIGLMPINPSLPTRPVPVAGPPPPQPGNVYHPAYGTGYRPGGRNLYDTPFVRDYVSPLLPQGEFQRTLFRQGLGDADSRAGQYGLSQYANAQRNYQAAQLRNPALSFRDFLSGGGAGNIMDRFRGLSASQRGLNPQARSSVVRWG